MTPKLTVIEGGKSGTITEPTTHVYRELDIKTLEERVRTSPNTERIEKRIRIFPVRFNGERWCTVEGYGENGNGEAIIKKEMFWSPGRSSGIIEGYIDQLTFSQAKERGWEVPDLPVYFAVWRALYEGQDRPREAVELSCNGCFLDPPSIGHSLLNDDVPGKRVITSSYFLPTPTMRTLKEGVVEGTLVHGLSRQERKVRLPITSALERLINVIEDQEQPHQLSLFTEDKPAGMVNKLAGWLRLEYTGGTDFNVAVSQAIREGKPELIRPCYTFVFQKFYDPTRFPHDKRQLSLIEGKVEEQDPKELVHGVKVGYTL